MYYNSELSWFPFTFPFTVLLLMTCNQDGSNGLRVLAGKMHLGFSFALLFLRRIDCKKYASQSPVAFLLGAGLVFGERKVNTGFESALVRGYPLL